MSELAERIRAFKADHEDWSNADIARELGCEKSTVRGALNPEQLRQRRRKDNARRRRAKQEHENRHMRDPDYRGNCTECGGLRGIGSRKRAEEGLCQACIHARSETRKQRIVELYEAGMSLKDIAADLGTTVDALSIDTTRLRKAGRIGYRYSVRDGKRVAA